MCHIIHAPLDVGIRYLTVYLLLYQLWGVCGIMPQRLRHIDRGGELQVAGFTLVELMIVVTIIGLLLSIALPEFSNYRLNAKIARTASEMRSLSTGFVAYKAGMFVYPEESHETLPPGMVL